MQNSKSITSDSSPGQSDFSLSDISNYALTELFYPWKRQFLMDFLLQYPQSNFGLFQKNPFMVGGGRRLLFFPVIYPWKFRFFNPWTSIKLTPPDIEILQSNSSGFFKYPWTSIKLTPLDIEILQSNSSGFFQYPWGGFFWKSPFYTNLQKFLN